MTYIFKYSPKPDVIYFMTDGAASVKGMEIIKSQIWGRSHLRLLE